MASLLLTSIGTRAISFVLTVANLSLRPITIIAKMEIRCVKNAILKNLPSNVGNVIINVRLLLKPSDAPGAPLAFAAKNARQSLQTMSLSSDRMALLSVTAVKLGV